MKKIKAFVVEVFERNRFIQSNKSSSKLRGRINIQLLTTGAFLLLSFANILSQSYVMLALTLSGALINLVFVRIAEKVKKAYICSLSLIGTCSVLFGFFVFYGGNDGFASLWVILMPLLSMVSIDFIIGLFSSIIFQVYLIVVFWTPVREMLLYEYSDQFCLRFPLLYLVALLLGLLLTLTLQKSEYNEYKHRVELEKNIQTAEALARTDPLTKLANRRFAYEEFDLKYSAEGVSHSIVMGDIDAFKRVNDSYGHKFGDEVLVIVAEYITNLLPDNYLKSRWGGEEFLFAANATIDEVYPQIELLRKAIAEHCFDYNGISVHITITFGISEYNSMDGLAKAISNADRRLYNGKAQKGNCVIINNACDRLNNDKSTR